MTFEFQRKKESVRWDVVPLRYDGEPIDDPVTFFTERDAKDYIAALPEIFGIGGYAVRKVTDEWKWFRSQ